MFTCGAKTSKVITGKRTCRDFHLPGSNPWFLIAEANPCTSKGSGKDYKAPFRAGQGLDGQPENTASDSLAPLQ
jgi:hypothetical protein